MYSHSRACIVLGCIIVLVVLCRCDNQHLYVVPPGGWKSPQSILQFLMVAGLLSGTLLNGSLSTSEFYGVWCSGFGPFLVFLGLLFGMSPQAILPDPVSSLLLVVCVVCGLVAPNPSRHPAEHSLHRVEA